MIIGKTPNGITTLTPDPGKGITEGTQIFDSMVFLSKNDTPSRWSDCDLPEENPSQEATEQDYIDALNRLGVGV